MVILHKTLSAEILSAAGDRTERSGIIGKKTWLPLKAVSSADRGMDFILLSTK